MLTLIRCPFHPVLLQWHVKDPGHPAKSAGGRLRLNTCAPLTRRIVWEAIRETPNTQPVRKHSATSSELAEPLWAYHGVRNGVNVCELISTFNKYAGGESANLPKNSTQRGKSHFKSINFTSIQAYNRNTRQPATFSFSPRSMHNVHVETLVVGTW